MTIDNQTFYGVTCGEIVSDCLLFAIYIRGWGYDLTLTSYMTIDNQTFYGVTCGEIVSDWLLFSIFIRGWGYDLTLTLCMTIHVGKL